MRTHRHPTKRPWGLADWFGLATLILLTACSAMLYVRLIATDMVTDKILDLMLYGLIAVNVIFLPFLLIRWRRAGVKIACAVLALIVAGVMIYGITAADTVQKALQNISGKQVEEEITYIYVDKDNRDDMGDAMEYNFGILSDADVENTTALVAKITEGLGSDVKYTAIDGVPNTLRENGRKLDYAVEAYPLERPAEREY